jgi:hypothetical protein
MHDEIAKTIRDYLTARRQFFELAELYPDEMRGNDNIIGRIGEYLALQFLRARGRLPTKTQNLSEKGFDLQDGPLKISVKIVTSENTRERLGRLKEPWDELILIRLHTSDLSGTVGLITRQAFVEARTRDARLSLRPVVRTSMLRPRGLIHVHGEVQDVVSFL